MGRLLHKIAMRAGTQVLSPIPESPSTSPIPVSDTDHDTGSTAITDTETSMAQPDVISSLESRKSQRINVEESFVEHLMSLNEDYRQQLEATRKELRLEREKNTKMEKDLKHYRVEFNNYKLSWTMDQAEINDLKASVQTLDTYQRQMRRMQDTITRLEKENNKFKALNFDADRHVHKNEEKKAEFVPRVPSSPFEGHRQRRPYTGKTRDEQTTALPPITHNNKVIMSSKQTASSEKKGGNSPTHLPSLRNICPTPPAGPRADAPRRRSRIPQSLVFYQIHETSSVGSVQRDHQANKESGRTSRASENSRRRHE